MMIFLKEKSVNMLLFIIDKSCSEILISIFEIIKTNS